MTTHIPRIALGPLATLTLVSLAYGQGYVAEQDSSQTLAPLLSEVTPAVVNVGVIGTPIDPRQGWFKDPALRRFFGSEPPPEERREGIGSGVIVDAREGLIVTNHHVISGAESIVVTLNDQRQFDATVVGSDQATDIALLKIEAQGQSLTSIPFGDSRDLEVGDFVVAIGNPFGLGQTATSGIVSGLGRSGINVEGYEDFIQTDASINPGNSGGALITLDGSLVGINSAIISSITGGNIGIGFAIPSHMVREVVAQLRENGEVRRGQLGIVIQDVNQGLAEALDLGVEHGALVSEVEPSSPAEMAGIAIRDVIVGIDGEPVESSTALRNAIGLKRVGERVTLTVHRDGAERTVEAVVSVPPATATAAPATPAPAPAPLSALDGVELADIPAGHPLAGVKGVLVVEVAQNSFAWLQGLRPKDVITAVNDAPVESLAEFTLAIEQTAPPLALLVKRGERHVFVLIE